MSEHTLSSGLEAELLHEEEALGVGANAYTKKIITRQQKGNENLSDYAKALTKNCIEPFAAAIRAFKDEANTGPGRRHAALRYLEAIDEEIAAFIALRVLFGGISKRQAYSSIALEIGSRIEDEVRFSKFETEKPNLFKAVKNNLKKNPQGYMGRVKRSMLAHTMSKFSVEWTPWPTVDKAQVGCKMLDIIISKLGICRMVEVRTTPTKSRNFIEPTPELTAWITQFTERSALFAPFWQPMICPPSPWTNPREGGYYHHRMRAKVRLVKTRTRGYLKELELDHDMTTVYRALNALQDTAWRINKTLLEHVLAAWGAGVETKDFPSRFDAPLPPKPDHKDKAAYRKYKVCGAEVFHHNMRARSKRYTAGHILTIARDHAKYPAIWFPYNLDFRGRVYTIPVFLNPQSCDLAKGLLEFAEGKPLGPSGARWLGIHCANTFGHDKVNLEDRVLWAKEHSEHMRRVAADPLADLWWTEADKPFQFLAACCDWAGYCAEGDSHVSRLPIMVDGSNNGCQHYSAMLLDPVCGRHVNLVPQEKPADIYQVVADNVTCVLEKVPSDDKNYTTAKTWLAYGVSRKMAKRPVMVLPYGGTRDAVRTYLLAYVDESALSHPPKPLPFPKGEELRAAVTYLAGVVWDVMKDVVVGPRVAMDWLKQVSKIAAKQDLPVNWTTPTGFWVQQKYVDMESYRIKTKVGDEIMKLTLTRPTDKLCRHRQATGIAPNFVHSLDASALMLTVIKGLERGVNSFAAIHDSYGTHAADMDTLQVSLRTAFVEMYSQSDVLRNFAEEIRASLTVDQPLPDLPQKGSLDLAGVLRAEFFFA